MPLYTGPEGVEAVLLSGMPWCDWECGPASGPLGLGVSDGRFDIEFLMICSDSDFSNDSLSLVGLVVLHLLELESETDVSL